MTSYLVFDGRAVLMGTNAAQVMEAFRAPNDAAAIAEFNRVHAGYDYSLWATDEHSERLVQALPEEAPDAD